MPLYLSVTHVISVILVLQKNTTLKQLDVSNNKIGPEGGKAIGKALEVSFVLVSFFFVFLCDYPSPSVTQLGFALVPKQNNRTLLTLYLNDNQIGDVGAAALGEGIAVSCVARWLLPFFVVG